MCFGVDNCLQCAFGCSFEYLVRSFFAYKIFIENSFGKIGLKAA